VTTGRLRGFQGKIHLDKHILTSKLYPMSITCELEKEYAVYKPLNIVKVSCCVDSGKVTVLIPAYNEAASICDTILSLQNQTVKIHKIIVIDDVSTDETAEAAASLGVTVIRPPKNTGSKAGAQNFGLKFVDTEFTMAIDADTTLAPDAI